VTWVEAPGRDWWVASGEPHASLRGHAVRYQAYYEYTAQTAVRRHPPTGIVPIIIGFDAPMRMAGMAVEGGALRSFTSFVAGPHDRFGDSETEGVSHGLQVDLTPIGAYLFFGVPLRELANRTLELEDIMGAEGREWIERLRVPTSEQAFDIVDEVIARRVTQAEPASRAVVWAWRRIEETGGRVRIGSLAERVGWSRKHLITRFREQVGMPPKTYARIVRFSRAVRLADGAAGEPRWVEIALRSGYYDQAHLIRDFVAFAGVTPTEYAARRLPGGGMDGARRPGGARER